MSDFGDGGFDVTITLVTGTGITVYCPSTPEIRVSIGQYSASVQVDNDVLFTESIDGFKEARVICSGSLASVYCDKRWVMSAYLGDIRYPSQMDVRLVGTAAVNATLRDMADYREAVYIDFETNGMSAYQNLLLGRPVDMYPVLGKLVFAYNPARSEYTYNYHRSLVTSQQDNLVASDSIVYYSDVAIMNDLAALKETGFQTRIVSLPDLTGGALYAAYLLQKRKRESNVKYQVMGGYDPSLLLGQIANVQVQNSLHKIIVEEISMSVGIDKSQLTYDMSFSGRKYVAE